MNSLESLGTGASALETALNVKFDNNFITEHIDQTLITLGRSFIDESATDQDILQETVTDILFYYVITGEFGLHTEKLERLYVEDEGLETEKAFDATTEEELYDLIIHFLSPSKTCKTYTLYC
jgi:hypothetical protein